MVIDVEEKWVIKPEKSLTKFNSGSILRKVPRGLRNSKPPET
jgi:hypothetical protein